MSKSQPLKQEDCAPCMDCGSVQCGVCSRKLVRTVEWLKQELTWQGTSFNRTLNKSIQEKIDEAFGAILDKEKVKK